MIKTEHVEQSEGAARAHALAGLPSPVRSYFVRRRARTLRRLANRSLFLRQGLLACFPTFRNQLPRILESAGACRAVRRAPGKLDEVATLEHRAGAADY